MLLIDRAALALPYDRTVGREAEPFEILEQRSLEFGAAARPVVVFDAQQHAAAVLARAKPHTCSALKTWPTCRYPVGAGANRVTTVISRVSIAKFRKS